MTVTVTQQPACRLKSFALDVCEEPLPHPPSLHSVLVAWPLYNTANLDISSLTRCLISVHHGTTEFRIGSVLKFSCLHLVRSCFLFSSVPTITFYTNGALIFIPFTFLMYNFITISSLFVLEFSYSRRIMFFFQIIKNNKLTQCRLLTPLLLPILPQKEPR